MLSKKKITVLLLVISIFLLFGRETSSAQTTDSQNDSKNEAIDNQIFVKFKKPPKTSSLSSVQASLSGASLIGGLTNSNLAVYEIDGSVSEAIQNAKANPNVSDAFKMPVLSALKTANDTLFNKQWALTNLKVAGSGETAWDKTGNTSSVKVAVVDSGVEKDHPDIKDKIASSDWVSLDCSNYAATNNCEVLSDGADLTGHGTHVAGIIGAMTNNSLGVAGVGADVKLMSVRTLNSQGNSTLLSVVKSVEWAVDHGAKIINLSLGIIEDNMSAQAKDVLQQYMTSYWNRGVLLVAASGNCGRTNNNGNEKCRIVDENGSTIGYSSNPKTYPAACDNVLSVGALTKNNTRATYSNYGTWVDVAAPGGECTETTMEDCVLSTWNSAFTCPAPSSEGNKYCYLQGTSMASPQVAGVAALLLAKNPSLTNSQLVDIITRTANSSLGGDASKNGAVDALAAVNAAGGATTTPGGPTATPGGPTNTPVPTATTGPSPTPTNTPTPTITPWPQNPPKLPRVPPNPYPTGPYCPMGT